MESTAREGGEAPEVPVEQATQNVEAEADTLKDVETDPLASVSGGEGDAAPPEPDSGLSAEEGQDMHLDHSAQQEPIQSAPPPVPEAPPDQEDPVDEPEQSKPAPERLKEPEPEQPVVITGKAEPAEAMTEHGSARKGPDTAIEAPKVVSDLSAGAGTSQGAVTAAMRPAHGGPTLGGLNGAAPQPAAGEASYRDIQVVPSEHHGSGPNFYDVTSVNAEGKPVATKRRFDDLVQLHEDLKRRFRGCVVPFRPGKTKTNSTVIMSHGEGFLKERAFAIKCYLNKVVQHPDMKSCEMLRQFMESTEVLRDSTDWTKEQLKKPGMVTGFFTSVKKLAGAVPRLPTPSQVMQGSGKSEHDLVRQMAEMRVSRRALHDHADVAERALLDMGDHVADMLKANQALSSSAMTLIDAKRKLIDTHADNGQGLHTLTKFEKEGAAASLPEDLRLRSKAVEVMEACVEAFGRTCGEAMHNAVVRQMAILEPIHDHAHTLPRVEKALASRLDALVVLESLRRQEGIINASYQQLLAKELGGVMRNADVLRMNRVREEVDQVQQAKAAAEKSYDLLKQRNERDIELYQTERNMSFCFLTLKFAEAHASLQTAVADVWEAMAAQAGADMSSLGPGGAMDLAYGELGEQVSRSAVVIERDIDAGTSGAPVGEHGPLPPELAGMADDD